MFDQLIRREAIAIFEGIIVLFGQKGFLADDEAFRRAMKTDDKLTDIFLAICGSTEFGRHDDTATTVHPANRATQI